MLMLTKLSELSTLLNAPAVVSGWLTITQSQINQFAQATLDPQWIHVDVEKAKGGPFGSTIAHGFLTLSLIPYFFESSILIKEQGMGVNYGLNKVRFTSPVLVNSELLAHFELIELQQIGHDGVQVNWAVKIERKGTEKMVCIAETIARYYPSKGDSIL